MAEESTKPQKVFISYAWEDDIKLWVRALATRLHSDGVETILDQWEVDLGDQLPEFMEKSVRASNFVLVICTPIYKNKSDSCDPSGVGYEKGVITGELFVKRNQRKFIPVLRKGKWFDAAPSWVLGKNYIDLRDNPLNEDNYQELLKTLYGKREPPPPLGTPPDFSGKDGGKTKPKPVIPRKPLVSKDTTAKFTSNLKIVITKLMPSFRLAGILVIISIVLLVGSWAVPKFIALIPTSQATSIATQYPTPKVTVTSSSFVPTKAIQPIAISTKTPTPVPTSLPNEITDAKGVQMVLVPSGKFMMGSDAKADQQPIHTVNLNNYYFDKYEVTNVLYKACVDASVCDPPKKNRSYTHSSYYSNTDFNNYPVIYVDWNMSKTYCEWRGARLPTEAEWEKAARGTNGNPNPWNGNYSCEYANYFLGSTNYCVGDTTAVGSYPRGISVYGVYDLFGNVVEWVADWYKENYYSTLGENFENPQGPENGQFKILRGEASWGTNFFWPPASTYRDSADPLVSNIYVGFRCARDATP